MAAKKSARGHSTVYVRLQKNYCFACGKNNPDGMRLRFAYDEASNGYVCRFRLDKRYTGPPGHAHGGIIATVLDEAMGKVNKLRQVVALTSEITINYLKPVPLNKPLRVESREIFLSSAAPRTTTGQFSNTAQAQCLFTAYNTVMPKISAGILLFRRRAARIEVLLVHPGGPFWAKKDSGAWSIPKGEVDEAFSSKLSDAALLEVARREFAEELGPEIASQLSSAISSETLLIFLGEIRQKSGKIVHAWAAEGDCDLSLLRSNTFTIEWPPRSGKQREFPEVDRAAFFSLDEARIKLNAAQAEFLERLAKKLDAANEHPQ